MSRLKVVNIAPALPPTMDGIGDYSARLCAELSRFADTTIIAPIGRTPDPIAGVSIEQAFHPLRRRSVSGIGEAIRSLAPDWVVLQFNQFSYGRWGLNPCLPLVLRSTLRDCPGTRLAVMFHEDFVPAINWKFAVMRQWQRWQFKTLGRAADVVMFSIDPWVRKYASWFPGKPVLHVPVGSNIPDIAMSRSDARSRLGIGEDAIVLGVFGAILPNSNVPYLQPAIAAARKASRKVTLLYVGADVAVAREIAGDMPIIATGALEASEVSRRLRAMDIFLAPFSDGVSTRRGSMMAGIQHGIATVSTRGEFTDEMLKREAGRSLLLAPADDVNAYAGEVASLICDALLREQLGSAAAEFYRRDFDWPVIARRVMSALKTTQATADASEPFVAAPQELVS